MTADTSHLLLDRVVDPETLRRAWDRVSGRNAAGGADGVSIQDFARNAGRHLERLGHDLACGSYAPEPMQEFTIPKSGHPGEMRILSLPSVRDKIAQQAVRSVIEPLIEPRFLDCSYGYRPGKGPVRAARRVLHFLNHRQMTWVVTADIDDFFGSVSHERLLARLDRWISEPAIIRLLALWVRMGRIDRGGRWKEVDKGLPQGGVVSPLLANCYLHPFDHWLRDRGGALVRYADDFVVLARSRDEAAAAAKAIQSFLEGELGLRLNPDPDRIASSDGGFEFLGIRYQSGKPSLAASTIRKKAAEVARLAFRFRTDPVTVAQGLREMAEGWRRYYAALLPPPALEPLERLFAGGPSRVAAWAPAPTASSPEKTLHLPVQAAIRKKRREYQRRIVQRADLVVNTPGSFVGKTGRRIVVRRDRKTVLELPADRLRSITLASHGVSISGDVVCLCAEVGTPVLFADQRFRVAAALIAQQGAGQSLGHAQVRALEDPARALALGRTFVNGKLRNQLNLVKYLGKYQAGRSPKFLEQARRFALALPGLLSELRATTAPTGHREWRDRLMSIEGRAAGFYWDCLIALLARPDFTHREGRGATDLVNSMLNYGYAVLAARIHIAILQAGLIPQLSILHAPRRREPTLVYDLIEEFRPQVVDRPVCAMIGLRKPLHVDGQGLLTDATRRQLLEAIYRRLGTLVPFQGETVELRDVVSGQARAFGRAVEEGAPYRPFIGRW
jgi:group II intron reverse transcriptase/maturase/CRISPR-associated endonuclease Cas1